METEAYVDVNKYGIFYIRHYRFPIFSTKSVYYNKESYYRFLNRIIRKKSIEYNKIPPTYNNYGKILGIKSHL